MTTVTYPTDASRKQCLRTGGIGKPLTMSTIDLPKDASARAETDDIEIHRPPAAGSNLDDWFSFPEIFRRVLASGNEELERPTTLLFWSGVAAGLALGLTFLARVTFTPVDGGSPLVANLLYPIGFLLIVLGRYQLFTENTLTPVALVLTRLASVRSLGRLWGVVLAGNLVGAVMMSALLAWSDALSDSSRVIAVELGAHATEAASSTVIARAVIAGWIVASMVWLLHGARETIARIVVVWALMYLIGVADLFHVVTGTLEVLYPVLTGDASWTSVPRFVGLVLLGNTVGGVVFVAVLNSAQFGREDGGRLAHRLRSRAAGE